MLGHLLRLSALILLLAGVMFRPFLPGRYDALAVTLSFMTQIVGFAGLVLLAPLGLLWLLAEWRWRAALRQTPPKGRGFTFALVALIAASLVALGAALPAFSNLGLSFGLATLALWGVFVWRSLPGLQRLRRPEPRGFHPAPLYLIVLPLTLLLMRQAFIVPATEYSRRQAIAQSAPLIAAIEAYRAANGRYPLSLASLWKDYAPGVIGIEQFHYEPSGAAYNVFFEQYTYDLAAREIVMYNPLNEQTITSHDSWILVLAPAELERSRGFFAVREVGLPNWKYFWFD